jgi:hypothetical protein
MKKIGRTNSCSMASAGHSQTRRTSLPFYARCSSRTGWSMPNHPLVDRNTSFTTWCPLHPSRCHLQPPAALGLRLRGRLPLEGLRPWQQAPHHDSLSGGVPAPFPTACFTQRLSPYPLLRLAGQPRTQELAPTLSSSAQPATARNRSIVFKPTCHLAVPTLPWPDVRHRTTHRCPDPFAALQTCMCL